MIHIRAICLLLLALAPLTFVQAQTTLQTILLQLAWAFEPFVAALTALALVVFVWGAVVFIANGADDKGRQEGRKRMVWGIMALVLIVGVWGIVYIIGEVVGINRATTDCRAPRILPDGTQSCFDL